MRNRRLEAPLVAVALVVMVLAVYFRAARFGFIALDDAGYVFENPLVLAGLTWKSVVWAFTTTHESNWHPLTWLSLMLDAQFGGGAPRVFHVTNLVLHIASTLLLFHLLRLTTGGTWRSAFVAALFGVHPLHVESVVWISERKDVLSTLFWMLTLLAYARYAGVAQDRAGGGSFSRTAAGSSLIRYALVLLFLCLGLMAKPMLVTLPLVLLLLDLWPLGRLRTRPVALAGGMTRRSDASSSGLRDLVAEKAPLLVVALLSGLVTLYAQSRGGSVVPLEKFPPGLRAANAVVSCVDYLVAAVWPAGLAIPYPYSAERLTPLRVAGSAIIVLTISFLVVRFGRARPYLLVGWTWYLLTLLPVIGLVQVGTQSRADRYTYIPLIGIFIMAAWGVPEMLAIISGSRDRAAPRARDRLPGAGHGSVQLQSPPPRERDQLPAAGLGPGARLLLGGAAAATVALLAACASVQVAHWQTGESLFAHTLAVTQGNAAAHNLLGLELFGRGRIEESIAEYEKALRIRPGYVDVRVNISAALMEKGRNDEASEHCRAAVRLRPESAHAHACLGAALLRKGELSGAAEELRQALRIAPDNAAAHGNLAMVLERQGKLDEALEHLREETRLRPNSAEAHGRMANVLVRAGALDEAAAQYALALRIDPRSVAAHKNLGVVLARQGRLEQAIAHFKEAVRLDPTDTGARSNLERARSMLSMRPRR